jgi:hypothetical protein
VQEAFNLNVLEWRIIVSALRESSIQLSWTLFSAMILHSSTFRLKASCTVLVFKVGAVVGVSDASDTLCFNTLVYYFSTEVYT